MLYHVLKDEKIKESAMEDKQYVAKISRTERNGKSHNVCLRNVSQYIL